MIEFRSNFDVVVAHVDAVVNTVNCVGVMGKGIALQFKQKYPENFKKYKRACDNKQVVLGKMFVVKTGGTQPKFIINFPTKDHWRGNKTYRPQGISCGNCCKRKSLPKAHIQERQGQ